MVIFSNPLELNEENSNCGMLSCQTGIFHLSFMDSHRKIDRYVVTLWCHTSGNIQELENFDIDLELIFREMHLNKKRTSFSFARSNWKKSLQAAPHEIEF